MIMALLRWDYRRIILIRLVCFFSSVYSLYLFSLVFHGRMNLRWENSGRGYLIEHLVRFVHYMPLLLIILNLCLFEQRNLYCFVYLGSLNGKILICGINDIGRSQVINRIKIMMVRIILYSCFIFLMFLVFLFRAVIFFYFDMELVRE